MTIIIKNKDTLQYDDFKFRCCIGKNGITKNKFEGDKKTPKGTFYIDKLYFRKDRIDKPETNLKVIEIKKNMGWCNDIKAKTKYNKLLDIKSKFKHEKLFRRDFKYNLLIPIKYNWNKIKIGKGSAIFIHLTKDYQPTLGCIGLAEKDLLILLKLIKQKTKIKIL
tara:strand:+ start:119 stop:613 length:495 start_codon:yes stop_codon:yes gene_type:complete